MKYSRRGLLTSFGAASLVGFARAGLGAAARQQPAGDTEQWANWSGSVTWTPSEVLRPSSVEEVVAAVRGAVAAGESVRVAGTGHSFTPLCATSGRTVLLTGMRGVESIDAERGEATVLAGTKLYELEAPLREAGWAMETLPDIDRQAVAGAIATATHGTGREIRSLSDLVTGVRLVDGAGAVRDFSLAEHPDEIHALQVSLGVLGVLTHVRLRVVPAFRLHERSWIAPYEEARAALAENIEQHRHFEFFWVSDRDACLLKTLDPTDEPEDLEHFEDDTRLVGERIGASGQIFTSRRSTRFNEIEYAVPESAGPACWAEIRDLMLGKHKDVTWPLEYRTVAAEPAFLSMAQGMRVVTLSLHQAAGQSYQEFFADAEAIFRNHGGRPHWGKIHSLEAEQLRALYPQWSRFAKVRERLDPDGRFLTPYLRRLLLA